jgi:cytochrome c-type biogenesis protein CcmE
MHPTRSKRLLWIGLMLAMVSGAVALMLYALSTNINFFFMPSQVAAGESPLERTIRLGGLVKEQSVQYDAATALVTFLITDRAHDVHVQYRGVLPDLFREGQGVVAQGKLNAEGVLIAEEILAKHDNQYMPPGMKINES